MGYNPYRKANGEFATKDEAYSQVNNDYEKASASKDVEKMAEIELYVIKNMDETPLGQKILEKKFGTTVLKKKKKTPRVRKLRPKIIDEAYISRKEREFHNFKRDADRKISDLNTSKRQFENILTKLDATDVTLKKALEDKIAFIESEKSDIMELFNEKVDQLDAIKNTPEGKKVTKERARTEEARRLAARNAYTGCSGGGRFRTSC